MLTLGVERDIQVLGLQTEFLGHRLLCRQGLLDRLPRCLEFGFW